MAKPDVQADINSPEGLEAFRKAAKAYGKRVTASKEAARAALVQIGTHTPKGNLTKRYKSAK